MNAHALPLCKATQRECRRPVVRFRLRRRRAVDVGAEQRPPLDMSWALYRLAPRV